MTDKIITFHEYLRVRDTVLTMLEKRGFDPKYINRDVDEDTLSVQFDASIKEKKYLSSCIYIPKSNNDNYENRQALVYFILNDKATYNSELKIINKLIGTYNIGDIDDIVVIVGHNNIGEDSSFYKLEEKFSNLVVFHYKNLSFDITEHRLVPLHIKIKNEDEKNIIKKELNIDSLNKLPVLLKNDAIARFYHYRRGDLIKIERPSFGSYKHIVYRIVL
jgi:DNA-directed RNA polymerase subunit H (RpoH/RPB5)